MINKHFIELLNNISKTKNIHYHNRLIKFLIYLSEKQVSKRPKGWHYHHIIPKSWNSSFAPIKENMILMTPKEHFIVHHLMYKSFPEDQSMTLAFFKITNTFKTAHNCSLIINAKLYDKVFKENYVILSNVMSSLRTLTNTETDIEIRINDFYLHLYFMYGYEQGRSRKYILKSKTLITSDETKKKISDTLKGHIQTEQQKTKRNNTMEFLRKNNLISKPSKKPTFIMTEEHKQKMTIARLNSQKWINSLSSESKKQKMSQKLKNRIFSEQHKENIRNAKQNKKICIDEFVFKNVREAEIQTHIPRKVLRQYAKLIDHDFIFFINI